MAHLIYIYSPIYMSYGTPLGYYWMMYIYTYIHKYMYMVLYIWIMAHLIYIQCYIYESWHTSRVLLERRFESRNSYMIYEAHKCTYCHVTHLWAFYEQVTYINESCHTYVWHDSFIYVTWLIHVCDMTHSHVWHDSFICVTWRIHVGGVTHSYVWHDSFICVTWRILMSDMTHSYVWPDSFHVCDMTHSYIWMSLHRRICCVTHLCHCMHAICQQSNVWHDSFICVTWLIHMCDMTHSYVWPDSFHICDMTHS